MVNKKGQIVFVGLMLAIVTIVFAIAVAPAMTDWNNNLRNQTNEIGEASGMDCSNASISDYDKGACAIMDVTTPYFIGGLIALAAIIIAAKLIIDNAA